MSGHFLYLRYQSATGSLGLTRLSRKCLTAMTVPQYGSAPQHNEAPVCKNHPNISTYVRCQRCQQPICPECMVQAGVGVQCPQCVREGAKSVRGPKTITGAEVVTGKPYVTYTLIAVCVVAWLLQMVLGWDKYTSKFVFAPFTGVQEPWRFLTAAFLHSDRALYHILFNMLALYSVGTQLEYILGRWHFLTLYILSALGGSVAVLLLADPSTVSWATPVLGASGAIFGLFGALVPLYKRIGGDMRSLIGLFAINAAMVLFVPNISWQGHLGGLITGLAVGYIYMWAPKEKRKVWAIGGSALVVVVLIVVSILKYASVNPALY